MRLPRRRRFSRACPIQASLQSLPQCLDEKLFRWNTRVAVRPAAQREIGIHTRSGLDIQTVDADARRADESQRLGVIRRFNRHLAELHPNAKLAQDLPREGNRRLEIWAAIEVENFNHHLLCRQDPH